jgi:hypothetical protein
MAGNVLTTASTVMCAHGGQAYLSTSNSKVFAKGAPALLETDVHLVVPGTCPFTVGSKYSPCVRIEWSAGASKVDVDGTPVLTRSSVGKCFGAEGAVQGLATIKNTQREVSAR